MRHHTKFKSRPSSVTTSCSPLYNIRLWSCPVNLRSETILFFAYWLPTRIKIAPRNQNGALSLFYFEINVKFGKPSHRRNKATNCSSSPLEQRCCVESHKFHAVKASAIPDLRGTFLSGSANNPVSYPTGKEVKTAAEETWPLIPI